MTSSSSAVYNGRYELRNQVARGGTAQVYLARDLLLDRPVALKVLDPQLSTDHTFVERFRREAQAAANLSHPNIVPVFDWGESDRTYFIVMEYVDGEPLSSIIRTQSPIPPEQAASIAADIAKALTYAHRHGVVHRDVKPGNVLITSDGEVKVTDFGIARAIGTDEQVTQTGLVMGTATYFSPEQAQGLGVDGRSDIYTLGVVLYEMVTGRPPFTGETPVSIAYQHVREIPQTPRAINPQVPPPLEAIILQAMAKVPAERYATAEDMRADLDRFLRHQPVLARPASEFGSLPTGSSATTVMAATQLNNRIAREPRRRTTTPYWVTAAIVLIAGIVAAVIFGGRSLGYFGATHYVTVPDVRSMSVNAAESALRAKGFAPVVANHVQGTVSDQNTIVSQKPTYPDNAKKGSTVQLTVADSTPRANVPLVTNMTLSQAQSALKSAGFGYTIKAVDPANPTQVNNEVVKQQPASGASKPKGTKILLSVVKTNNVIVPSLTNDNEGQAGAALQAAGFTLGTVTQQFSSSVPQGQVISSSPSAQTSAPKNSTVNIVVSQGAGVAVPNLLGDSQQQAISALQSLGLIPEQGAPYPTKTAGYNGNVAFQGTAGGRPLAPQTLVAPGTTVKYRLGVLTGSATTTTTLAGNTGTVGNTGVTGATGVTPPPT